MHKLRSPHLMSALALVAGILLAPPAARAGLIYQITVVDLTGDGLSGEGWIRFADEIGSCGGSDCLTLLDGIEVRLDDGTYESGDYWGSPGEVVEATWEIDLTTGILSGFVQLGEKSGISALLSFTDGYAENFNSGVRSSLEVRPLPEPAGGLIFAFGLATLWRLGRRSLRRSPPWPGRSAA